MPIEYGRFHSNEARKISAFSYAQNLVCASKKSENWESNFTKVIIPKFPISNTSNHGPTFQDISPCAQAQSGEPKQYHPHTSSPCKTRLEALPQPAYMRTTWCSRGGAPSDGGSTSPGLALLPDGEQPPRRLLLPGQYLPWRQSCTG